MVDDNTYITSTSQAVENKTMTSLLCMDKKEWDSDIVKDIFNIRDQECILKTTLQVSNDEELSSEDYRIQVNIWSRVHANSCNLKEEWSTEDADNI